MPQPAPPDLSTLAWHDARNLTVEGLGFSDRASFFDRLPARAQSIVLPHIWERAQYSPGVAVRFTAHASRIAARWRLRFDRITLLHMPATAALGLDLYIRDGQHWRWIGMAPPSLTDPLTQCVIVDLQWAPNSGPREFMLYLPLYNGVDVLEIGINPDAQLTPGPNRPPHKQKPLCIYGTSIVHGACASRPGMPYPAILGRRLDRPVLNFGFAGYAWLEPEIAHLLAELDPAAYILDPLPNQDARGIASRMEPFVHILRKARPSTPIFLMEYLPHFQIPGLLHAHHNRHRDKTSAALRAACDRLLAANVPHLHYIPAQGLLGDDGEALVDGIHPTDLGYTRIADALLPRLQSLPELQ